MSSSLHARAEQIALQFGIPHDDLARLTVHLVEQLKKGLSHDGATQMPSYITRMPTSSDTGVYLAVDLGGTNCRVCAIELHGSGRYTSTVVQHAVPRDVSVNTSYRPLFRFIAHRLQQLMDKNLPPQPPVQPVRNEQEAEKAEAPRWKLGFTLSFTFAQRSLNCGTLLHWDKDWDIPDAIGRDPCAMLQEALDELGLAVQVSALINDSVGALLARMYTCPDPDALTLMSAIFGTGTNAAYVEYVREVKRLAPGSADADSLMIINTEWGALGSSPDGPDNATALPTAVYDEMLDAASTNPKKQALEKRISGLYLGELLRLVVLQLLQENLFSMTIDGEDAPVLHKGGVGSALLSTLAACADDGERDQDKLLARRHVAKALGTRNVSADDANAVQAIAAAIGTRAAQLSAAALASIVLQSGRLAQGHLLTATKSSVVAQASASVELSPIASLSGSVSSPGSARASKKRAASGQSLVSTAACLLSPLITYVSTVAHGLTSFLRQRNTPAHGRSADVTPATKYKHLGLDPALVLVSDRSIIDIGVDGSLIEFHPHFIRDIRRTWRQLPGIGPEGDRRIHIGFVQQGSLLGAALAALTARASSTQDENNEIRA